MQSNRDNDSKKNDNQSTSSISGWLFYKTTSLIQYSFEIISSAAQQLKSSFGSGKLDSVIKYPIDSLQMAYNGPSVLYLPDRKFNQTQDLIGWTTDRHPTGIFLDTGKDGFHHVKSSFNLDDVSDDKKEKLLQKRNLFYKYAYLNSNTDGYCNMLSHRGCMGEMQSTFGFYGTPSIEALNFIKGYQKRGFIIGIRAFGNEDYYSSVNGKTYQLAKIDLNTIDLDKINREHNRSLNKIAHVYLRNNTVQQRPDTDDLKNTYKDGSLGFYENYIKNLPNFSDTVDWVIPSSDLPSALQGNPVINMMDNKEINILEWQNKQQEKSQKPLDKYGIFALPRPSDYDDSYERDKMSGKLKKKPPILFKIGKK